MMAVQFNEPTDLSGLDVVLRLKADFVYRLGTLPRARWIEHVIRFVAALERSDLRDRTALIVVLAEVWEEIRLRMGVDERSRPSDVLGLERLGLTKWTRLPLVRILAQFQEAVVRMLLPAAPLAPVVRARSSVVQQAKSIIDQRYAEPLTLQDLAVATGRSKRHLGTLFEQQVGMPVHRYLTRVRLRRALGLIRQGEKIEAVSLLVGYRSKANFYRHFKAQTGITPLAYRSALVQLGRRR
jgi:AraC-like DNA-binding protein